MRSVTMRPSGVLLVVLEVVEVGGDRLVVLAAVPEDACLVEPAALADLVERGLRDRRPVAVQQRPGPRGGERGGRTRAVAALEGGGDLGDVGALAGRLADVDDDHDARDEEHGERRRDQRLAQPRGPRGGAPAGPRDFRSLLNHR